MPEETAINVCVHEECFHAAGLIRAVCAMRNAAQTGPNDYGNGGESHGGFVRAIPSDGRAIDNPDGIGPGTSRRRVRVDARWYWREPE